MDNRIYEALDQIHAEADRKARVKANLAARRRPRPLGRLAPVLACLVLVVLAGGGSWLYFQPTAVISVDINPSLELAVNRFDKVVGVQGYNQDGQALADSLDLRYLDYHQAVEELLASPTVAALLDQEELLSLTVAGDNAGQCSRLLTGLEDCTQGHSNAHCGQTTGQVQEEAHDLGLSCGKYRAYLALKELDPAFTPEEAAEMTVGEIYQRIAALTGVDPAGETAGQSGSSGQQGHNGQGEGKGHHHGGGHE